MTKGTTESRARLSKGRPSVRELNRVAPHPVAVSQAGPYPFRSADRFQYASLRVPHTESDQRCGTEKVWLMRLVDVCEILAIPVHIQHTTFLASFPGPAQLFVA